MSTNNLKIKNSNLIRLSDFLKEFHQLDEDYLTAFNYTQNQYDVEMCYIS